MKPDCEIDAYASVRCLVLLFGETSVSMFYG